MRSTRARDFWCPVVSEAVLIRLTRPSRLDLARSGFFVKCNQTDCQYVDANEPPCPLHVDMFRDEIEAGEVARAARRAESDR